MFTSYSLSTSCFFPVVKTSITGDRQPPPDCGAPFAPCHYMARVARWRLKGALLRLRTGLRGWRGQTHRRALVARGQTHHRALAARGQTHRRALVARGQYRRGPGLVRASWDARTPTPTRGGPQSARPGAPGLRVRFFFSALTSSSAAPGIARSRRVTPGRRSTCPPGRGAAPAAVPACPPRRICIGSRA